MNQRSTRLVLALAWSLCASTLAAQESSVPKEPGAIAPAGTWTVAGGSPARTGATATVPIRRDVERAWERKLGGKIESEPLVWDQDIHVELSKSGGKRSLVTVELATGKLRAEYKAPDDVPLQPSIWGNFVALAGAQTVDVVRRSSSDLQLIRRVEIGSDVSTTLLFEDELYVGSSAGVHRAQPFGGTIVWHADGKVIGPLALRGEHVYATFDHGDGACTLTALDRESGARVNELALKFESAPTSVDLVVNQGSVYLQADVPVQLAEYETPVTSSLVVSRNLGNGDLTLPFGHGILYAAPTEWRRGWLGYASEEDTNALLLCRDATGRRGLPVLTPADKAYYNGQPVSVASDVAFAGGGSFTLPALRVLTRSDVTSRFRPVPAKNAVIHVVDDSSLLVLRRARSGRSPFVAEEAVDTRLTGRAVLANANVVHGDYEIKLADGVLNKFGKRDKREPVQLAQVRMVETEDGKRAYAADLKAIGSGWKRLASSELAEEYARLALHARSTNDVALIQRMMKSAMEHGSEDSFDKVISALAKLEKRPGKVKANKARGIVESAASLGGTEDRLWARFQALDESTPTDVRHAVLRSLLAESPEHEGATEYVRGLLPDDLQAALDANPLEWLDYQKALEQYPAERIQLAASEGDATPEQRALGRAVHTWREDLVALQSERLLLIGPPTAPAGMAHALRYGELICRALEETIAAPADGARERLTIQVYESLDEYSQHVRGDEPGLGLEWRACIYNTRINAVELFLPGNPQMAARAVPAFAHQLAHQWIRETCSVTHEPGSQLDTSLGGYWIIEGIATLAEDFEFDVERGEWSTLNPRSDRLDLVAGAPEEYLLPWKKVLTSNVREFVGLSREPKYPVDRTWTLGEPQKTSKASFFYGQAAATCQYLLHADEGAQREKLVGFLRGYYSANEQAVQVKQVAGLDEVGLGGKVREFAIETIRSGQ